MSQYPRPTTELTIPRSRVETRFGRVLVVETNPAMAELAVLVLTKAGHEAFATATAHDALTVSQQWHPDLVLLELSLPDFSGANLCRQLRRQAEVQVIASSLDSDPDEISAIYAAGACAYLPKPFRVSALLDRIHTCLGPTAHS
ncbi:MULTISPECIES: response regulator transcription factor [unclassified Nocardia]|uniref:response regulator transcription factor n=1 Tax=unclassified Nocardia TaxID=2637762 RepID=UPI0035DA30C0